MALLPPGFLDAVVAIGFPKDSAVHWAGTAFLYFKVTGPDENDPERVIGTCYLVTNKHVIGDAHTAKMRCNPSGDGPAREYTVGLCRTDGSRMWTGHPDADVDVAVIPINLGMLQEHGMAADLFIDTKHATTAAGMAEGGVTEGDGVFVLGFPMSMVGGDRNFVIVRSGSLARVRDAISGASKEFLIDATVFPGNSGGPVLLRPELASIQGTQAQKRCQLIGIVGAYVPYQDAAVSQQTGRPRIVFEENTGLSVVHPVDYIDQTIAAHEAAIPTGVAAEEEEPETINPSSLHEGP